MKLTKPTQTLAEVIAALPPVAPDDTCNDDDGDSIDGMTPEEMYVAFLLGLTDRTRRAMCTQAKAPPKATTAANVAKGEPTTPTTDIATIYYHGGPGDAETGHSYSVGDALPVVVSVESHKLLHAFMTKRRRLGSAELEGRGHEIANASLAVNRLEKRYGGMFAGAIIRPGRARKGTGYFARVEPAT